jgi:hypothetical protein
VSLFNLSGVVQLVGTHDVTVKRPSAQTWAEGGFANPVTFTTSTAYKCSVQPGAGTNLVKAPEGTRPSDIVRVWGAFEFQAGDRLTIPGFGDYEVFLLDEWAHAGAFTKCFARALNSSEPRP